MQRHPVFDHFKLIAPYRDGDFRVDCLGVRARAHYMPDSWFDANERPQLNELLFEWIDLLDAVRTAGECVTVIDLGAGYGKWLSVAAAAATQLGKRYHVVGVEAEPTHFAWMLEHMRDNGVVNADTIKAVVSDVAREVYFVRGHASEWYGQCTLPSAEGGYGDWPDAYVERVTAISAVDLIKRYPLIDALHMDLQAEEARVVPAIMQVAAKHVRRMHVETHWPEIDYELSQVFQRHGWRPRWEFPCDAKAVETPFGAMPFLGGVQSWENPRFDADQRFTAGFFRLFPWLNKRASLRM